MIIADTKENQAKELRSLIAAAEKAQAHPTEGFIAAMATGPMLNIWRWPCAA